VIHGKLWLGFLFLATGLILLFGCSSGHGGGYGNVSIEVHRHYGGPPPTDPGPTNKRGRDSG
jgi:hypothetical protein